MKILSRLFRGEARIPFRAPLVPKQEQVANIKGFLEASGRIESRFDIDIDDEPLKAALVAVERRGSLVPLLQGHDIGILDFEAVRRHQKRRVRGSMWERYVRGWRRLDDWFFAEKNDKASGIIACFAGISFFVTLPLGIPLLIDWLWYDVSFFWSYLAVLGGQFLYGCAAGSALEDNKEGFATALLGFYTLIAGILILPISLLLALTVPWLMASDTGREWKTLSLKELAKEKVPWTIPVNLIDRILQALPNAEPRFEVLFNPNGTRGGEAFLTIDTEGGDDEVLHIWHGRM